MFTNGMVSMSDHTPVSTALQECLNQQVAILAQYVETINALIAVVIGHDVAAFIRSEETELPPACVPVLALMLQAIGSSTHTLVRLSDQPGLQTRDCYSIARSVIELAINICYIATVGPEAAERAARHAKQKAFRDLSRESQVGESVIRLAFRPELDPDEFEGVRDSIEEFTSRGGREKGWMDASIDERIAAVEKCDPSAMTALHWARFAIYRHSSEVLHGTYFSTLHFFGLTDPSGRPRSLEEMQESFGQQHMLVLMSATLAVSATVRCFHSAYGFRAAQQRDEVLMKELREIPYFRETDR